MSDSRKFSRRRFLRHSAAAVSAGVAAPYVIPGDDEASGYLDRPKREAYRLPEIV